MVYLFQLVQLHWIIAVINVLKLKSSNYVFCKRISFIGDIFDNVLKIKSQLSVEWLAAFLPI